MTHGQKIGKLIDALDNGAILFKEYENVGEKEFLFKSSPGYYELKGWASALGTVQDRLEEIFNDPDVWKIFPNFDMNRDEYPYPWSINWEEK